MLRMMTRWFRALFQRDESAGLAEEIRAHIAERIDDLVESGVPAPDAWRQAHREFGNRTLAVENARAVWSWQRLWERRVQDLRLAVRTLTKHPGLSAAVVLSVALGIGANTAIFSILDSLVLKSLPVPRPDRLVQVTPGGDFGSWTYPLWEQFRDRQNVLEGVFAWSARGATFDLSTGGQADRVNGLWVSASFFDVLGVPPALGRTFAAADDMRGGGPDGPVAVISHGFWQRRFAGAVDVIGRPLSIERIPFTIVGVAPAGFLGPNIGSAFDVAVPIGTQPLVLRRDRLDQRTWWWLTVMGRLKPGQTTQAAAAALVPLQPILREHTRPPGVRPDDAAAYLGTPMVVKPASGGPSSLRDAYQPALILLMGIVGLILLIACVNVANLLLARAERRRRDVSLQMALGASRGRLAWQSLVESLLLSALGAAVGLAMAMWAARWLVAQIPQATTPDASPALDLSLDWRVLGFTTAVAVGVALLFGTIPALFATNADPMHALREQRATNVAGRRGVGGALVAIQVALCLVLVVGAGLFVRTFTSLTGQHTGVDRDRVLVVEIDARRSAQASFERGATLYSRVVEAVRALPGVAGASFSAVTPVSNNTWDTLIQNPVGLSLSGEERRVYKNEVSPAWFSTYGIPFVAGRDFDVRDQAKIPTVAIVNEAFVRRYFAGKNPVGQTIREVGVPNDNDPTPVLTIVGVVKDAVYVSLREGPTPTMYLPTLIGSAVSVRAANGSPAELISSVRAAIGDVDRDLSLTIRPLASDFAVFVARERILALMSGFFGVLALLLSAIGLYGIVSYGVGARRAEIGIRMALGASRFRVVWLVVRRVAILVSIGVLIGVPVCLWSMRFVSALLFGLQAHDPATYLSAVVVLMAVGVAAAWMPARRAARINPAITLRAD
jgi:putative ABC transport system permease protein